MVTTRPTPRDRLLCLTAALIAAMVAPAIVTGALAEDRLPWLRDGAAGDNRTYAQSSDVERDALPPALGSSAPRAGAPYESGPSPDYNRGYDRGSDVYRPPASTGRYASPDPVPPAYDPPPGRDYDDRRDQPARDWRDDAPPSRYASTAPPPYRDNYRDDPPPGDGTFSMREIIGAGHGFFGSISQGLASVIEHAFKTQGRPNGYILGEDAGGAFVAGLRYGEGRLYTRDAGTHRVYWQGPSIGYDAGAEGSKVMVLVYRLRDPDEIYQRFGGVAGSAYIIGGVGLTFQQRDHIVLAPIRAGIGFRLGANVGYLKYTRRPTWNPF